MHLSDNLGMRNPTVKIETKRSRNSKYSKPLSDREIRFCDILIEGKTSYYDAMIQSGMASADDDRIRVQNKANNLLKTARVKRYMQANAKTIRYFTNRDYDILKTHMYDIAMGTAKRVDTKVTKEGNIVSVESGPSFRDQIAAAAWISADIKASKDAMFTSQEILVTDMKEISEKTKEFVDKYTFRKIEDKKSERIFEKFEPVVEANFVVDDKIDERYSSENIRNALEEEFGEYRIHS